MEHRKNFKSKVRSSKILQQKFEPKENPCGKPPKALNPVTLKEVSFSCKPAFENSQAKSCNTSNLNLLQLNYNS